VSSAKIPELIEMQSGVLSRVGPGNGRFWGFWLIKKHCKE